MCDPRDLGTSLGDAQTDEDGAPQVPRRERGGPRPGYHPTLFLYEHVPGGTGLAERIWEQRDTLLERTLRMIESCPCPTGCPACVGPGGESRKRLALALLRRA
jgi:DEAD/DEAH box helicase domain-containing protein